ncbi:MAG: YtxH domain-containing protein [Acidobacteriota bacterium]
MAENKNSSFLEITLSFLLGTMVGVGLGLLFAPASGVETRKKLREVAEKTAERAKEEIEKLKKKKEPEKVK